MKGFSEQDTISPEIEANNWQVSSHKAKKLLHSRGGSHLSEDKTPENRRESLPATHLAED